MKILSTLAASLFLMGCAVGSVPQFPEAITDHYMVDVREETFSQAAVMAITNLEEIPPAVEQVRCIKFTVVSTIPYKIKYVAEVPMKECNGVGGYKPKDSVSLYNWMSDVAAWAEGRKKCFK